MSQSIAANPDRLLPADPGTRSIARELLQRVQDLPIISPHGHVDAAVIEHNTPFPDPAALLVSPDHYVTRLIHASGVPLDRLRGSAAAEPDSRTVWREFCKAWPLFEGTASGYWLRTQFEQRLRPPAGDQRRDRRCQLRCDLRQAAGARLPAPPALQGLQHRGPGHHGRPPGQPRQPQGDRRGPHVPRPRPAHLPPGRLPQHRAPHVVRERGPAHRGSGRRRHRLCRLHHRPGKPASLLRGPRRSLGRPRRPHPGNAQARRRRRGQAVRPRPLRPGHGGRTATTSKPT